MQLKTCLGCYSLRAGTLFAGIMSILGSLITIAVIWTVPGLDIRMMVIDALGKTTVNIILTLNLCMTVVISYLLIVGTLKRKTILMLPWVVLGVIVLISALISVFYTGIRLLIDQNSRRGNLETGILLLILGPIIIFIMTYFWLVSYSHFQEVRAEKSSVKIGPYGRPYNYRRA